MATEDLCESLDWDSAFFGCRVARLAGNELDPARWELAEAWCRSRGIDCLYFLCDSDDERSRRTAEGHGFRLVDERLTLAHDLQYLRQNLPGDGGGPPAGRVRPFLPTDLPALRTIARSSHVDSRFYHDGIFSRSRCDALYESWIESSCRNGGETVFVAEVDSQAVGYVTCRPAAPTMGHIGLLAVAAANRGHGLGRSLIQHALGWFAGQGLTQVCVVTQRRNDRARQLYEKSGFVLRQTQKWFHRWFLPHAAGASA